MALTTCVVCTPSPPKKKRKEKRKKKKKKRKTPFHVSTHAHLPSYRNTKLFRHIAARAMTKKVTALKGEAIRPLARGLIATRKS